MFLTCQLFIRVLFLLHLDKIAGIFAGEGQNPETAFQLTFCQHRSPSLYKAIQAVPYKIAGKFIEKEQSHPPSQFQAWFCSQVHAQLSVACFASWVEPENEATSTYMQFTQWRLEASTNCYLVCITNYQLLTSPVVHHEIFLTRAFSLNQFVQLHYNVHHKAATYKPTPKEKCLESIDSNQLWFSGGSHKSETRYVRTSAINEPHLHGKTHIIQAQAN